MCNKKITNEQNYKLKKSIPEDLKQYLYEINQIPLLTSKEERELFELYKITKKLYIRQKIIDSNLRLVVSIAQQFIDKTTKYTLDFLDVIQYGNEGLMKAVEKFDVDKGYKFSTYATYWIKMYIEQGLNDFSRTIRTPSYIVTDYEKIKKYKERQIKLTGVEPSNLEISKVLGLKEDYVKLVRDAMETEFISIHEPIGEKENSMILDFIPSDEQLTEDKVINKYVFGAINSKLKKILTKKEYKVISMEYGIINDVNLCSEPLNFVQIGKINGITCAAVSKTEKRALQKLRDNKNKFC